MKEALNRFSLLMKKKHTDNIIYVTITTCDLNVFVKYNLDNKIL